MPEANPTVAQAAADFSATLSACGWAALGEAGTAARTIASGTVLADAEPGLVEAIAALTTTPGAAHSLATATDPVDAATAVTSRLVTERGVEAGRASWATAVVLEAVQPGWGVHVASLAQPPPGTPAGDPAQPPRRRSAARFVFPAVVAVVVIAAIAATLVFVLSRSDDDTAAATTEPTTTRPRTTTTTRPGTTGTGGGDLSVSGTATPGEAAPQLSGTDMITGQPVSLAAMRDRPTLVVFWAHWCPHCQKEMPVVEQVANQQAGSFNVLTVATAIKAQPAQEQYSSPERFIETTSLTMPTLRDGTNSASNAYGIEGFPSFYMVDTNGNLVGSASGELPAAALVEFMQRPTFE